MSTELLAAIAEDQPVGYVHVDVNSDGGFDCQIG